MKKVILIFCLMCSVAFGEEWTAKHEQIAWNNALYSYLAQGGGMRLGGRGNRGKGWTYTKGKLKGKTEREAVAKFNAMWRGVSQKVKIKYYSGGIIMPLKLKDQSILGSKQKDRATEDQNQKLIDEHHRNLQRMEDERKRREMQAEIDRLRDQMGE